MVTTLKVGSVCGKLTVLKIVSGAEIGHQGKGRYAYVRCTCGTRRYLPARQVGSGYVTCGCRTGKPGLAHVR